ncbi:serine/threonine-protein kinase [Polyangium sp. 15x6]|uniref:serine/threonine-protein kinase n=1 Tax=Polyangium sp. 15x6 TaxID=3042687 RepID=UPI00249C0A91|nr:serine/threonine-protein kinase [Polyangium sp. 15x6]MDI3287341.1 protein kinase [Polyangium sp. 15x6]
MSTAIGEDTSPPTIKLPTDDVQSVDLRPGKTFAGRFELISKLGEGAFGQVWKAINTKLHLKVAIKIPRTKAPDDLERFRREAQALCLIDSEYVLRCFEYGDELVPFLVMELLTGESLAKRLEREGPMPMPTVKSICRQLCKGLHATHAAGVIHRDLKPGNIYCIEGKVKIVDFGLMKLVEPMVDPGTEIIVSEHDELTQENMAMGTVSYMSPEQWHHSNRVDFRSDLWSLAAVLYRLLTGKSPFAGAAHVDVARLVLLSTDGPPPISHLPSEVNAFFRIAFQRDPKMRFQSAAEFGAAFDAFPDGSSVSPPAPARPVSKRSIWAGGAAVSLVIAGVFVTASARPDVITPMCDPRKGDCDGAMLNGCETDLTRVESCGACGVRCINEHGSTSCVGGFCAPVCAEGFADCDGERANGCEADLGAPANCGKCGNACTNQHGDIACVAGQCAPTCQPGFMDCDGNLTIGCETDVVSSALHCGICGRGCNTIAGDSSTCQEGICKANCDPGRHDCNGDPADGCEVDAQAQPEALEGGRCKPVVLGRYEPGALSVAVDDDVDGIVAWTVPRQGKAWRMRKDGGVAAPMSVGGAPTRIAFDTGRWYWTDTSSKSLVTIDSVTATRKSLVQWLHPEQQIAGLASSEGGAFFLFQNATTGKGTLFSARKELGKKPLLEYDSADPNPFGFATGRRGIYFVRTEKGGSIWGWSYKERGEAWLVAENQERPFAVAVDPREEVVVWSREKDGSGTISIARRDGPIEILAANEPGPRCVAVDEAWVYWTNDGGMVKKARLDGKQEPVLLASAQERPMGIALDATRVYWVNEASGEVVSVAK